MGSPREYIYLKLGVLK